MAQRSVFLFIVFLSLLSCTSSAWSFSFGDYEQQSQEAERSQECAEQLEIATLLATPCSKRLKNQTTAFVLTQKHSQHFYMMNSAQDSPVYAFINGKLNRLGLKTLSPQQIEDAIADAEAQAFLSNDMDAAASAAERLRAKFIIKGQVVTSQRRNPVVGIDEISVTLVFTLSDERGRIISNARAQKTVFSDSNISATLLTLVEEQGEKIVAQLYRDFCQQEH